MSEKIAPITHKRASDALFAIAQVRRPTEDEVVELTPVLMDDNGERGGVELTAEQVVKLKAAHMIRYCGNCTMNTINDCAGDEDGGYTAAEYHPTAPYSDEIGTGEHSYACIALAFPDILDIQIMVGDGEQPCAACVAAKIV